MANLRIEIKGQDEVLRNLALLGKKMETSIGRKAVRAGLKPIQTAMEQNAARHQVTGALAKSIISVIKAKKGAVDGRVGPDKNFAVPLPGRTKRRKGLTGLVGGREQLMRKPQKYAHLIEFGTYRSRAFPFMRPAFDAQKGTAEQILADTLWSEIEAV